MSTPPERGEILPPNLNAPARCGGCRMPRWACFCADIPVLPTRTRVIVVRQRVERFRTSNTGWLVARSLPTSELYDHGMPGQPLDLTAVVGPDAWVLGPGAPPPREDAVVRTVVVIDGAWSQVRGMRRRIPPLASLPTLSLPSPDVAPARMRRPLRPGQLATVEAVAAALELLGEEDAGKGLRDVFAVHAARVRALRGGFGA